MASKVSGKVVSISGDNLTVSPGKGKDNTSHAVAPNAEVTLNGVKVTLRDLKEDDAVNLEGDPATKVVATR